MKYKIVFSDIDGTLLNEDKELSPATIEAIKNLDQKIPFVLVSARMPAAMRHLQEKLGITQQPIICFNGSLVMVDNKPVSSTQIENSILKEIIEGYSDKLHLSLYHNDEWYVPQYDKWAEREENNTKIAPEVKSNKEVLEKWQKEKKGAHKIMAMGKVEVIEDLYNFLNENYHKDLHLYRSKETYIEIAPKSISKLTAIKFLLEKHFNFSLEETIAIGDNYNDVEMLKNVGYGIAVENGRQEAIDASDVVCGKSIEDGVAKILTEIFKN